jgi:AbiTii
MSTRDLIQEIQAEAVDGNSDLSTVLRKCLVLGSRLAHQPLKDWSRWELDGYPESTELPDYRILHGIESFGIFLGAAGSGLRNVPISALKLPEQVRDRYINPPVRQGARAIAEMLNAGNEGAIQWAWPAIACEVFDHEGYRSDLRLMQAWLNVPVAALVGILDTIRNRVLSFVLEIESVLGPGEEAPSKESKQTKAAQITQTFHQTIYGSVANVGTADSISQTMIVAAGDLEGLKTLLREKGFPEADLQELQKAIKADEAGPKPTKQHFGKNVANWFGETVKKAGTGALKLGMEVVATQVTKLLKDYYGVG